MTDIVGRLLRWSFSTTSQPATDLMDEAAREITRLRGRIRQKDEALDMSKRCADVLLEDYRNLSDRWDKAIEQLPLLAERGRLMEELEFLRKVVRRLAFGKFPQEQAAGRTPDSPCTPGEGTWQGGCTLTAAERVTRRARNGAVT